MWAAGFNSFQLRIPVIFPNLSMAYLLSNLSGPIHPSAIFAGKCAKLSHPLHRGGTASGHPHSGVCGFARFCSISKWCWF